MTLGKVILKHKGLFILTAVLLISCNEKKSSTVPGTTPLSPDSLEEITEGSDKNPSKSVDLVTEFANTVYPVLRDNCAGCHADTIAPYFANADPKEALSLIETSGKMNTNNPEKSRIVERLFPENHNCWGECEENAKLMAEKINEFALNTLKDVEQVLGTAPLTIADATADANLVESDLSLIQEAELGMLAGTVITAEDETASGGSYAYSPNNAVQVDRLDNADNPTDTMTYTFDIAEAGSYRLFVRAKGPTGNDDSFFARVDQNPFVYWDFPEGDTFTYDEFRNQNDPVGAFNLTAGAHTVEIARREAGILIDTIVLTADPAFAGATVNSTDTKKLTYDISELCNVPGASLEINVAESSAESFAFSMPVITTIETAIKVKGLRILINGSIGAQYVTYARVEREIAANAKEFLLENGAMIVLKEGEEDRFSFKFDECAPM